jgi:hypothetical protein
VLTHPTPATFQSSARLSEWRKFDNGFKRIPQPFLKVGYDYRLPEESFRSNPLFRKAFLEWVEEQSGIGFF